MEKKAPEDGALEPFSVQQSEGSMINWQRRQKEELVKQEENQENPFYKSKGMNMFQGECPLWGSVLLKDHMR